jgi:hypothetical protein
MMRYFLIAAVLSLLTVTSSACSPGSAALAVEVSDPWVRAPAAMSGMSMDTPGALYMVIRNRGDSPDRLLKVESDAAGIAQVHLTEVGANGVASMHQVDGLEIPAGGMVQLTPGSYHIMLMDMKRELMEGEMIKFVLTFEKAGRLEIEAPVKAP